MSALSFEINLTGSMAPAAEGINKALAGTEHGAKHAAEGIHLFEAELGKASVAAGGFGFNLTALAKGGHLFTFDLAEGAEIAVEMFKELGEVILDIGKEIIKTAASTEDLNLALELNVGKKGAEEFEELAESFQKTTRFSAAQMKEAWLPLLDVGLKEPKLIDDLSTAAADIAARTHGGISKVQEVLGTFRGMFLKDQVSKNTFTSLGITSEAFYADLGKQLHVSAQAAEKMAKGHKVSSDLLLHTALGQVAARQEGGKLGGGALPAAATLGGLLDRVHNIKENLFEKLAGSAGMQAVAGTLDNLVKISDGPIGKQLIANIGGAFEKIFGSLAGPEGRAKLEHIVTVIGDKLGKAITWVASKVPAIIDGFDKLPDILNRVVSYVEIFATVWAGVQIVSVIGAASAALPVLGTALGVVGVIGTAAFSGIGIAMAPILAIAGPVALILGGISVILGSIGFALYRIISAVKELGGLGAVFHDLGDFIKSGGMELPAVANGNAGFAAIQAENARRLAIAHGESESSDALESVPAFASGGIVNRPTLALVGEAGPEAIVPLSGARRSFIDTGLGGIDAAGPSGAPNASVTFAPVFHLSGGDKAEDVAGELEQRVRVQFKRVLEEAGLAFGAG